MFPSKTPNSPSLYKIFWHDFKKENDFMDHFVTVELEFYVKKSLPSA